MRKWIIFWDAGYGEETEVIEAANQNEADEAAYEQWHENVESNANYYAKPYTKELAEENGLE